jgi:hypothetical protein
MFRNSGVPCSTFGSEIVPNILRFYGKNEFAEMPLGI